ncbi:MAG: transcriptional repressor [Hyphomonadaceae bacterium]
MASIPNKSHLHLACSPSQLAGALREAEDLCGRRGGALTPLRRQVLTFLLESDRPIKAYDMLQRLRDDRSAKPPTIYRTLDFLIEMGLAHRIESLNAFVPCGHWDHGHAAVFLLCEGCGSAGELHAGETYKKLAQDVSSVNFKMRTAVIEVRGLCLACSS